MDEHQKFREKVAAEYGIALYRRYREKEAAGIVGYEAAWWKRHRKAGTIPYVQDAGGGIGYFGYMLCDLLILGKDAVKKGREPAASTPPASRASNMPINGGASIAAKLVSDNGD